MVSVVPPPPAGGEIPSHSPAAGARHPPRARSAQNDEGEQPVGQVIAMVSGKGDAGPVAKAIKAFSTETKGVLSAKGGYFDGEILNAEQVIAIADLPGKDALRAQLLGLLVAVPTGLVRVLNAKASSIVNVINAYKNKLEENS